GATSPSIRPFRRSYVSSMSAKHTIGRPAKKTPVPNRPMNRNVIMAISSEFRKGSFVLWPVSFRFCDELTDVEEDLRRILWDGMLRIVRRGFCPELVNPASHRAKESPDFFFERMTGIYAERQRRPADLVGGPRFPAAS